MIKFQGKTIFASTTCLVVVTIILSNDFPVNSEQVEVYQVPAAQPIYVTHIKPAKQFNV